MNPYKKAEVLDSIDELVACLRRIVKLLDEIEWGDL